MKLNANCGSIRASRQSYEEKKRVNDEIIMKCLVTMILELLLQNVWDGASLTQMQKKIFFKNA